MSRLVVRAFPIARGVGRERFVNQRDRALMDAELEFGIGQHQAAALCPL